MSWFDGLIKLFPGLKEFTGVKLFSDNETTKFVVDNRKIVNINIGKVEVGTIEYKKLQRLIKNALVKDDELFIDEEANVLLGTIENSEQKNVDILVYFRDKIPKNDILILRAALVLREAYQAGQSVSRLKTDISQRYGDRGNNISNLCTAGYFETVIKPLYEKMSAEPDFSPDKFRLRYEKIVTQYPFAVFVCRYKSGLQIAKIILAKINMNKKYGINYLNIHGIGSENVRKVRRLLDEDEIKSLFSKLPEIESDQNFIVAKIWF